MIRGDLIFRDGAAADIFEIPTAPVMDGLFRKSSLGQLSICADVIDIDTADGFHRKNRADIDENIAIADPESIG